MSNEKLVLYQKWPSRKLGKYSMQELSEPTKMLTVFPATTEGLDEAIEKAERKDALLVKIDDDVNKAKRLIDVVEDKIKAKKGMPVFKPTTKMPRM